MTDRQLKLLATKTEKRSVFENFNPPCDITTTCSDGRWIKRLWKNPDGTFGWGKWEKEV